MKNKFSKKNTKSSKISNQIRSVTQSCPTLCDPMNSSMPGLPVHHQLPELTETHVHRVSDAIQPSHPLSSPSPLAPNPFQHQSLFQWVKIGNTIILRVRIGLHVTMLWQGFHDGELYRPSQVSIQRLEVFPHWKILSPTWLFKKISIHSFIFLCQVSVAACRIFSLCRVVSFTALNCGVCVQQLWCVGLVAPRCIGS